DAVITTGDGNVLHIFKGSDAETIRKIVQQALESSTLRGLLTHAEFSARAEQATLTSHQGALVGREAVLETIKTQLQNQTRVIVLHGPGGIGKTRLLLALRDIILDGAQLWYTRTEAESIERDLVRLDHAGRHVIVVDDAHRFAPLSHLHEVLVNPDFADKVTLVLATRSVFKDSVTYQLGSLPGDRVSAIEIKPLPNVDIDQLLQHPPYSLTNETERRAILGVAEGNPLIAGIAAHLVQQRISLVGLTRDQVLTRHLDGIVHNLAEAGYDDQYFVYLEILAALETIDLENAQLNEIVQRVVGISPSDEQRIVTRLVEAGLVERYWKTVKIASEVLADHILIQYFFNPKSKRADYQTQIIEPFFTLKPQEILTNLAEAEIKGESPEAGAMLGEKMRELHQIVHNGDNLTRWNVLDSLEKVAYLRPDDLLVMVATIVDGPEQQPTSSPDPWRLEVKHEMVLDKAVDILSHTTYRGGLRDAAGYLYKLARYKMESVDYARVREKAGKALFALAEFKAHKPYTVQLTLLEMIPLWLAWDFTANLDIALALLDPMLSIELTGAEADPTEPFKIVLRRDILNPVEQLRQIREEVLSILYQSYMQTSALTEQLKIVHVLGNAVPHIAPTVQLSDETRTWLQPDCENTARFFSEKVIPNAELPVLDAVATWLWRVRCFGGYQLEELKRLRQQLQDHKLYQLYRVLVGWNRWDEEEGERIDGKAIEQRRQQAMEDYLASLSPTTLEQAVQDLGRIAEQARNAGEYGTHWLNRVLQKIGEKYPELACQLITKILAERPALKYYISFIIAGLQSSTPDIAWAYRKSWVDSDDSLLWLVAAHSFHFVEWSALPEQGWGLLRSLLNKTDSPVDLELLHLTRKFARYNQHLAVETLKTLAVRDDEAILRHVAEVLAWPEQTQQGYVVEFANLQDYLEIIQNFERLPSLDYHVEQCLNRLGQLDPLQVLDFIERRISSTERRKKEEQYDAIPFQFFRALESLRSSPVYSEMLRRVRDWMLREDFAFQWEAPHILKEMSRNGEEPLYIILREWVETGDPQKLKSVVRILRKFNASQTFYDLCRKIVSITDDENVLRAIAGAIYTTPGVISGPMSNFTKQRLEEISSWLQDEHFRVRHFAQRMVRSLQGKRSAESVLQCLRA
ncbi:MAG: hypothetical protein AB7P69_24720, partial [Candidatus Binatia bacterium]